MQVLFNFYFGFQWKNLHFYCMKMMTVKEYAELKGQSLAAIYKQIAENRIKFQKKFGRLVVVVHEKSESVKA